MAKGKSLGPRIVVDWGTVTKKLKGKTTKVSLQSKVPSEIAKVFGLKEAKATSANATVKKDKKGRQRLKAPSDSIGAKYLLASVDGKFFHRVRIPSGCSLARASTILRSGKKVYSIKFPNGPAKRIGTKGKDPISKAKDAKTPKK